MSEQNQSNALRRQARKLSPAMEALRVAVLRAHDRFGNDLAAYYRSITDSRNQSRKGSQVRNASA